MSQTYFPKRFRALAQQSEAHLPRAATNGTRTISFTRKDAMYSAQPRTDSSEVTAGRWILACAASALVGPTTCGVLYAVGGALWFGVSDQLRLEGVFYGVFYFLVFGGPIVLGVTLLAGAPLYKWQLERRGFVDWRIAYIIGGIAGAAAFAAAWRGFSGSNVDAAVSSVIGGVGGVASAAIFHAIAGKGGVQASSTS